MHHRPHPRDIRGLRQGEMVRHDGFVTAGAHHFREIEEGVLGGLAQRRTAVVEALGAEHQLEQARVVPREGDIGPGAALGRRLGRRGTSRSGRQRGAEAAEGDRRQLADQTGDVAEMMGRCCVRDARLARHRAQRQPLQAVARRDPRRGLQQRVAQIAVMIGLLARSFS